MDANTFWSNVKPLIKSKKITQQVLADDIGISFNTLQSWITKDRLPDVVSAFKIAQALGVSVEYLVTGKETDGKKQILEDLKNFIDAHS